MSTSSPTTFKQETTSLGSNSPSERSSENDQQRTARGTRFSRIWGFFGFKRLYNFTLWIIFAGAMLGFSFSRLQDFNYDKLFAINIAPGYMYYFHGGSYRIGMIAHLACALPAGILMVLQFTPIIRHKFLTFHRLNGYFTLLLLLTSNVAACVVLRHNHGGDRIAAQTAESFLVIITTIGIALAWWNIRRLQVDQHRAWMLRTMFYYGSIVTSRIITNLAMPIITRMGDYYMIWKCDEIDYVYKEYGLEGIPYDKYPQCLNPNGTNYGRVVVSALALSADTAPEQLGASSDVPFGAALWLSVVMHLVGIEIYLQMTPRESARLRRVSYEKQLEAGMKHPGSAGLTTDRWGDAEKYTPR